MMVILAIVATNCLASFREHSQGARNSYRGLGSNNQASKRVYFNVRRVCSFLIRSYLYLDSES